MPNFIVVTYLCIYYVQLSTIYLLFFVKEIFMRRQLKNLKEEYLSVLEKMISQSLAISPEQDKYSGIFLSQVYENYFNSKLKVVVVK